MFGDLLRHRDFCWLTVGRTVSLIGNGMAPIALAFAVLDLTGSAADLGVVVAGRSVAMVVVLLAGGVIADRLPRAAVLQGSSIAAGITQALVASLVLTGTASVPLLVVLSAVNGALGAVFSPASSALTPQTVPADALRAAQRRDPDHQQPRHDRRRFRRRHPPPPFGSSQSVTERPSVGPAPSGMTYPNTRRQE